MSKNRASFISMKLTRILLLAGFVMLLPISLFAEEKQTIATDRPDFVESSNTVGMGRFQVETSINQETNKVVGSKSSVLTTPTLMRLGFSRTWELRFETDGGIMDEEENGAGTIKEEGFSDISLGFKWHSHDGEAGTISPSVGWLIHTDISSGSSKFRSRGARPSLRGVAEWEFPYDFSLGVMPGVIYDFDQDNQRFIGGIFGLVVGKSWSDNFRTFLEVAGQQLTSKEHGGNVITYDAGAAYLLRSNFQIDTAASIGATDDTPDFSWTVGVSMLY